MASIQSLDLTYGKALLVNSSSHTKDPRIMHEMCVEPDKLDRTIFWLVECCIDLHEFSQTSLTAQSRHNTFN